jgi:hypothetical protein
MKPSVAMHDICVATILYCTAVLYRICMVVTPPPSDDGVEELEQEPEY